MDQLTAYKILELNPGASPDDIKAAYAELSKKYHPEEHPEQFQQIHDAYRTLSRGTRRPVKPSPEVHEETLFSEPVEEKKEPLHFQYIETEDVKPEQEETPSYDFEQALGNAEQKERDCIHELTLKAAAEMQLLLTPSYCDKLKLFKTFFQKPEYQDALKEPEFLQQLSDMLADTALKKTIYRYMIDYYRLRGLNVNDLIPEAQALYHVLNEKCGMRESKPVYYVGILAGVWAGARTALKNLGHLNETIGILCLCVGVVVLSILLYKKLYENHSSIFAQAVIAVILLVSQFLVVGTELYNTTAASLLFLAAGIWLIVLGILAIIKRWKRFFSKKR